MEADLKLVKSYWKLILQIALGLCFVLLAVVFVKHERTELTFELVPLAIPYKGLW